MVDLRRLRRPAVDALARLAPHALCANRTLPSRLVEQFLADPDSPIARATLTHQSISLDQRRTFVAETTNITNLLSVVPLSEGELTTILAPGYPSEIREFLLESPGWYGLNHDHPALIAALVAATPRVRLLWLATASLEWFLHWAPVLLADLDSEAAYVPVSGWVVMLLVARPDLAGLAPIIDNYALRRAAVFAAPPITREMQRALCGLDAVGEWSGSDVAQWLDTYYEIAVRLLRAPQCLADVADAVRDLARAHPLPATSNVVSRIADLCSTTPPLIPVPARRLLGPAFFAAALDAKATFPLTMDLNVVEADARRYADRLVTTPATPDPRPGPSVSPARRLPWPLSLFAGRLRPSCIGRLPTDLYADTLHDPWVYSRESAMLWLRRRLRHDPARYELFATLSGQWEGTMGELLATVEILHRNAAASRPGVQ